MDTGFRSSIGVEGNMTDLVFVAVPDRPVCIVGLELLEKAVKAARAALSAIGRDPDLVEPRDAECQELQARLIPENDIAKSQLELGIPARCLPSLRAGLSLEWEKATKMLKAQQELVMETDETATRIKQIDRVIAALDVAGLGGTGT